MKIIDVSYNLDFVIEHSSKFVIATYTDSVLTEQKINKKNFENILVQLNTIIQQKLKAEAAKKRKAPSLSMLSNVLATYNFQPADIEDIFVKSGIDPAAAKKAVLIKSTVAKKPRASATVPATPVDPTDEMKKIINDLSNIPYTTPAMQHQRARFQQDMLNKIEKGIDKAELIRRITMEIQRLKYLSLKENASGGATSSGSVASVANPGGPMMPAIKRMPAGQSFFAPYQPAKPKRSKKKAKKR